MVEAGCLLIRFFDCAQGLRSPSVLWRLRKPSLVIDSNCLEAFRATLSQESVGQSKVVWIVRVVETACASSGAGMPCFGPVSLVLLKSSHFLVQALPILGVLHYRRMFATWDEVHDLLSARVLKIVGIRTKRATVSLAPQEAHFGTRRASTATATGTVEGLGVFETFGVGRWRAHLLDLLPGGENGCNVRSRSNASYVLLLLFAFFLLLSPKERKHLPIRRLLLLDALAAL